MTEKIGFFQSLWEKQHGRQYQISAVVSGASTLLFVLSGYQLLFLQNHVDWGDMTGVAIATLVISGIVMMLSVPTFFVFKPTIMSFNWKTCHNNYTASAIALMSLKTGTSAWFGDCRTILI